MFGPSESLRAFIIGFCIFIGSLLLTILTAAALYAPEEVFKSAFHIATFVILVVISIVIGLTGVIIVVYFNRRQAGDRLIRAKGGNLTNRLVEGHEV
jgi:ABC-type spermidine/putrescine transport system permease subunit II